MKTIGIVAGSFDPITRGHEWLIEQASQLVNELHIAIGVNPAKKYTFTPEQRKALVEAVIRDIEFKEGSIPIVHFLENELLINFANRIGATHIIRGIRDASDFSEENRMATFNRKISPNVKSVFMMTPPELTEVSSSIVKGAIGYEGGESAVAKYVHTAVLSALKAKIEKN